MITSRFNPNRSTCLIVPKPVLLLPPRTSDLIINAGIEHINTAATQVWSAHGFQTVPTACFQHRLCVQYSVAQPTDTSILEPNEQSVQACESDKKRNDQQQQTCEKSETQTQAALLSQTQKDLTTSKYILLIYSGLFRNLGLGQWQLNTWQLFVFKPWSAGSCSKRKFP